MKPQENSQFIGGKRSNLAVFYQNFLGAYAAPNPCEKAARFARGPQRTSAFISGKINQIFVVTPSSEPVPTPLATTTKLCGFLSSFTVEIKAAF